MGRSVRSGHLRPIRMSTSSQVPRQAAPLAWKQVPAISKHLDLDQDLSPTSRRHSTRRHSNSNSNLRQPRALEILRMLHLQLRRQPLAPLPTPKALLLRLRSISLRLRSLPHRRRALLVRARRRSDPTTPMLLPQRQLSAAARPKIQPQPSGRRRSRQRLAAHRMDLLRRPPSGEVRTAQRLPVQHSQHLKQPAPLQVRLLCRRLTQPVTRLQLPPPHRPAPSPTSFARTAPATPHRMPAQDHPTTTSQRTKTRCARSGSKTLPKSVTVSSR